MPAFGQVAEQQPVNNKTSTCTEFCANKLAAFVEHNERQLILSPRKTFIEHKYELKPRISTMSVNWLSKLSAGKPARGGLAPSITGFPTDTLD